MVRFAAASEITSTVTVLGRGVTWIKYSADAHSVVNTTGRHLHNLNSTAHTTAGDRTQCGPIVCAYCGRAVVRSCSLLLA